MASLQASLQNTLDSRDNWFNIAVKSFIFWHFKFVKSFHETRDILIIFLNFINIAMYLWILIIMSASEQIQLKEEGATTTRAEFEFGEK